MWKGRGRSGYGESSTLGDYDDWSCLSRNGRQWKNPITMETRDLSGADYWHMRKQLTDSYNVPDEMHAVNETVSLAHTLPSGKANLAAYGDPVLTKRTSKVNIKDKILPQFRRLNTLQSQMVELEQSYKAGEMGISEYSLLRDCLVAKKERAEVLYHKAISVKPRSYDEDDLDLYEEHTEVEAAYCATNHVNPSIQTSACPAWLEGVSDDNSCKKLIIKACKLVKVVRYCSHKTAAYYKSLKEV